MADRQKLHLDKVFETGLPVHTEDVIIVGGRDMWQDTCLTPLKNDDNETYAVLGISRDITERKRAEDVLQETKQTAEDIKAQYEQAVSMISDIVWRYGVNAKGEHVGSYISPVADRMLGLPDGTIGNSFEKYFSYIHPDDLQRVLEMLFHGIRTLARDLFTEYRLQKADGTTIWVRSKGSAYSQSNGIVTAFGTTSDITDTSLQKRTSRKARRNIAIWWSEQTTASP